MKRLLLLRHAKSSWDDPALADFDRPLAKRGIEAARRMGREIARRGWVPDRALVSPARRTRQTWDLAAAELPSLPPAEFPAELYEASAEAILALVRRAPADIRRFLVVGHNPGLEDLAAMLAGPRSDTGALARMREKFPTGALARLEFEGEWQQLDPGNARLVGFFRSNYP